MRIMFVSGGWRLFTIRRRTCSLEMVSLQDIASIRRRPHWSKASIFLVSCLVGDHVSALWSMTVSMKTRLSRSFVWIEMEECHMFISREAVQLCAVAMRFVISCLLDLELCISTCLHVEIQLDLHR